MHTPSEAMEMMASTPLGIFDMMGPRTFEGGYSPSHVISSAMNSGAVTVVGMVVDIILLEGVVVVVRWMMAVCPVGTNAEEMATMVASRTSVNFVMIMYTYSLNLL
jgi:hypothetical protein